MLFNAKIQKTCIINSTQNNIIRYFYRISIILHFIPAIHAIRNYRDLQFNKKQFNNSTPKAIYLPSVHPSATKSSSSSTAKNQVCCKGGRSATGYWGKILDFVDTIVEGRGCEGGVVVAEYVINPIIDII